MGDGACHLPWLDQAAERAGRCSLFQPVLGGAVLFDLSSMLGLGLHPSRVDLIDPDVVPHQGKRKVPRHDGQGPLGHRIGTELGLPAMSGGRADVHDRANRCGLDHESGRSLGEEVRGPEVEGHHMVEVLGGVAEQGGPGGCSSHIDHTVHGAEFLGASAHDGGRGAGITHVGFYEHRSGAGLGQLGGQRFATVGRPPDQYKTGPAVGGQATGHGLPQTLRAAVDDGDKVGVELGCGQLHR